MEKREGGVSLLKAKFVKPGFSNQALELIRNLDPSKIDLRIEYMSSDLLSLNISDSGWDNWQIRELGSSSKEANQFKRKLTTEKAEKMANTLKVFSPSLEQANILFIACGEGIDLATFIDSYKDTLKGAHITAFDQSEVLLKKAEKEIKEKGLDNICKVTFKKLSFDEIGHFDNASFTHAFALGVFDRETLIFDSGIEVITKIRMKLVNDGILITSAYNLELFNRSQYKNLGFNPLYCCNPAKLYSKEEEIDFSLYVLQNSNLPIQAIQDDTFRRSINFWKH